MNGTSATWFFGTSTSKDGYIKWYVIGSRDMGRRKEFPEYKGKKLCQICAYEVFTGEDYSDVRKKGTPPKTAPKVEPSQQIVAGASLTLQR